MATRQTIVGYERGMIYVCQKLVKAVFIMFKIHHVLVTTLKVEKEHYLIAFLLYITIIYIICFLHVL